MLTSRSVITGEQAIHPTPGRPARHQVNPHRKMFSGFASNGVRTMDPSGGARTPTRDPTVKIMCAKTIERHHDNVTDCWETPRRCPCLLGYPITMIMYAERLVAMPLYTGAPHGEGHVYWETHGDAPVCCVDDQMCWESVCWGTLW